MKIFWYIFKNLEILVKKQLILQDFGNINTKKKKKKTQPS